MNDERQPQGLSPREVMPVECDACGQYDRNPGDDWSFPRNRTTGPVLCPDCHDHGTRE